MCVNTYVCMYVCMNEFRYVCMYVYYVLYVGMYYYYVCMYVLLCKYFSN